MPFMMHGPMSGPLCALCCIFMLITLIGTILFIIWAYKFLKEPRLRELVIIFLSVGLVGLFLTAAVGGMMHGKKGMKQDVMKFRMMDGDEMIMEPGERI